MKVKINKLPKSQVELKIEVPAEEFNNFIERATLNLGKNLEIKGFRKGKAPKNIIEEHIGPEKILIEASDLAVNETYKKAILENKIEAVFQPKIEIKKLAKGNDLVFSAKTAVLPEIKLPDYKKIASKIKRNKVVVDEREIGEALKWLQKSRAKFTAKNQAAQKGDFVEIEYQLSHEEKPRRDAFILGEGHFIPGFEEKIVGMSAGEEKDIKVHPVKSAEGGAAKPQFNRVKVISVQNVEFPEANDEFAKSLGKFENLDALKKNIKQGLVLEKEEAEKQKVRQEILERISEKTKIEIPEILIKEEQKQMLKNLKKMVSERLNPVRDSENSGEAQNRSISNGIKIPFADYLNKIKKSEKEILDSFLLPAQKKVKNFLILREIGKREKIELDSEGLKGYSKIFQLLEKL